MADAPKRHRSPAYPYCDLGTAVGRAERISGFASRHAAPLEVIADEWTYAASSSGFLQNIAALKQFGLLVDEGSKDDRKVLLTALALDIIHGDRDDSQYQASLKQAALHPKLYSDLWENYDGHIPESDATLRHYLIRELGFNPASVGGAIKCFRDTIAFAGLENGDIIGEEKSSESNSESATSTSSSSMMTTTTPRPTYGMPAEKSMRIPITLPSLKVAWLEVPHPLSQEEFRTLEASLAAFKVALTTTTTTAMPQSRDAVGQPGRIWPG